MKLLTLLILLSSTAMTFNAMSADVQILAGEVTNLKDSTSSDRVVTKLRLSTCEFDIKPEHGDGLFNMLISIGEREFLSHGINVKQLESGECELHFDSGAESIK